MGVIVCIPQGAGFRQRIEIAILHTNALLLVTKCSNLVSFFNLISFSSMPVLNCEMVNKYKNKEASLLKAGPELRWGGGWKALLFFK